MKKENISIIALVIYSSFVGMVLSHSGCRGFSVQDGLYAAGGTLLSLQHILILWRKND